METQNKVFTPEESMRLITQSLSNFKKNYREKSKYTLLWGWVVMLASFTHFGLLKYLLYTENYDQIMLASILNWCIAALTGYGIQLILVRKSRKKDSTLSHLDRFYIILWRATAIGIVVISFLSIRFSINPPPFIFAITGLATLASGWVIRFRPLILGGISFFVFSIITAYITNEYQLLISALAIILGYLIPGYLLRLVKE